MVGNDDWWKVKRQFFGIAESSLHPSAKFRRSARRRRLKERALARVTAPDVKPGRFRPDDQLLAFLEAL